MLLLETNLIDVFIISRKNNFRNMRQNIGTGILKYLIIRLQNKHFNITGYSFCLLLLLLPTGNNLLGQACEDFCSQLEILNYDFEQYDINCLNSLDLSGFDPDIPIDCVPNWFATETNTLFPNTVDLYSPDFTLYPDYPPIIEVSGLLSSTVLGLRSLWKLGGSAHFEEVESDYIFPPNVILNVSVDVAAFSMLLPEDDILSDHVGGASLTMPTDAGVESIPMDDSFDVRNGW